MTAALAERSIVTESAPTDTVAADDKPARKGILGLNDRFAAWVKRNPRLAVILFIAL